MKGVRSDLNLNPTGLIQWEVDQSRNWVLRTQDVLLIVIAAPKSNAPRIEDEHFTTFGMARFSDVNYINFREGIRRCNRYIFSSIYIYNRYGQAIG